MQPVPYWKKGVQGTTSTGVMLPIYGDYGDDPILGETPDGNIILFKSGDALSGDTSNTAELYEYNVTTGKTTLVSSNEAGAEANESIATGSMSADGRYVAFETIATNLSSENPFHFDSIYVKDVQTGAVEYIGQGTGSTQMISADGRFVTYSGTLYDASGAYVNSGIIVADLQAPLIGIASSATLDAAQKAADSQAGLTIAGRSNLDDGTAVTVTFNGDTYTTALAQGGWAITVAGSDVASLADGAYTITASATDSADRLAQTTQTFTVDTVAPDAPVLAGLTADTDSGNSQSDGLTNVMAPTVTGTAEAGATVTLYDTDGSSIGQGTADASTGIFQIQTNALTNGLHAIVAVAADAAGNIGTASGPLDVTIETTAPAGSITPDSNAAPDATSVDFTVDLGFDADLDQSDFVVTADGTAAGAITDFSGSGETYTFTVSDVSGVGNLGLALASGVQILDAAGNAEIFTSTAHVADVPPPPPAAPVIENISPSGDTNSTTVYLAIEAAAQNETIDIFDGQTLADSYAVGPNDSLGNFIELDNLTEGTHVFTAVAEDTEGTLSAPSAAQTVTVDLTPPSETVASLVVNDGQAIGVDQQLSGQPVDVTGTLSAQLAAGDQVMVTLGEETQTATVADDGIDFSASFTAPGIGGTAAAYVTDAAGNDTAATTETFTADAIRTFNVLSAPGAPNESDPVISGDGKTVVFDVQGQYGDFAEEAASGPGASSPAGLYVDDLTSGVISLAAASASSPSLDTDGSELAYTLFQYDYDSNGDFEGAENDVYVKDLSDPGASPILVTSSENGVPSPATYDAPSLSGDGSELVFAGPSPADSNGNSTSVIYLATLSDSDGTVSVTGVHEIADDTTGSSYNPYVSEDGSTVVFSSSATDLVPPDALNGVAPGTLEIYAEKLTGPDAGAIELVSASPDGTASDTYTQGGNVSANGRYAVFTSSSATLAPSNLPTGQTLDGQSQEVFVKDLSTGDLRLVSINADGQPADHYSSTASISADGRFVTFVSSADNLAPNTQYTDEVYVADLATGAVTLASEPGGVPADSSSENPSLSDDGSKLVFSSYANNLIAGKTDYSDDIYETDEPTCYCPGTLIETEHGEIAVENLVIGDRIMTLSGDYRPIKWIGRRSYGGRFIMGRKSILPICIKTGAIADNVPLRDLWISPHHAMYIDGMLIEAKDLVNGVSVVQAERMEKVEYFHIELDTHDVIIAEGALSETYLDDHNRGMFQNAHEYRALYAEERAKPARYCAPRLDCGYEVEQVRRKLAAIAARDVSQDYVEPPLRGFVDLIDGRSIRGWAQDPKRPEVPVCLEFRAGSRLLGYTMANEYRADLKRASLGSGNHAFAFELPSGEAIDLRTVVVLRANDGSQMPFTAVAARKLNSICPKTAEPLTKDMRIMIMQIAHQKRRTFKISMSEALKQAWNEAPAFIKTRRTVSMSDLLRAA